MTDKIFERKFVVFALLIVIFAAFLRFVNYTNRFGIAYDQAHDALVARHAVSSLSFPLVGPFSSGAQFQESGVWYWFLMVPTFLSNDLLIAPWVATTLYCVLFVFAIILVGAKIVDRKFGLIVGLFAAISTSQIGQSVNLSLTALISLTTLASIYFASRFLNTKKNSDLFWFSFFVSLSLTIHLQAVLLLVIVPILLFVSKTKKVKLYLTLICGFFIPLIPLIIFDLKSNFVNISGLVNYAINKQGQTSYEVLGRRWLTYISVFWPSSWANIIGGILPVTYLIFGFIIIIFYRIRKKVDKIWIVILTTLLIDILLARYVRSPLFDSYLNFLHPFILLITAYAVYQVIKWKKLLGLLLLLIIIFGSLYRDYGEVKNAGNVNTVSLINQMKGVILKKYPNKEFDFYDYAYKQVDKSLPLVLFMDLEGMVSRQGVKIGITTNEMASRSAYKKVIGKVSDYLIVELGSSSSASLEKLKWANINPSNIYDSTENWYNKK